MKHLYTNIALALATALASMLAACSADETPATGDMGYLTVDVTSVATTYSKGSRAVPADYDARRLSVEVVNAAGEVVESVADAAEWQGRAIQLPAGRYTVNAHSADWDGRDSGRDIPYYAGSTAVTIVPAEKVDARITCTLANVKVSVNFDASVIRAFKTAWVEVSSAVGGVAPQTFTMLLNEHPAYFPVGDLTATLTVVNNNGERFTQTDRLSGVQARDHYILNYTTRPTGTGSFTVSADGAETQYTYTFCVPTTASTTLTLNSINAWSNFAWVEGSIPSADIEIDDRLVKFAYKAAGASEWTEVPAQTPSSTPQTPNSYRITLRDLAPATTYSLKMVYADGDNTFSSAERTFTTEGASQLPNGNLDEWCNGGAVVYPNSQADYLAGTMFWDTSNPGSATVNRNVTTRETADVHTPGGSAARLASQYVIIKFAAASMYAGSFGSMVGTSGAKINFGQPWTDRPTQLRGWFKYSGGIINRNGGAPEGVTIQTGTTPDLWSAYIVLADEGYTLDNTNLAATAWNYQTDKRVVAYGALPDSKCVSADTWTQFTVDLDYHDLTRRPKSIIVVFSSSKYGDYFTGSDSSVLLLDDLELVYGEPNSL